MFNERIDNEDITLIRGESLSIDVYLTFDSGEPVTHAQIPASKIKSCLWLQNGIRIPLIVTELEEESCYNLRSDIDTRSIKGDSFLVNVAIEEFTDTAPDNINIATFNQTFYIVNSATDVDIPLPDPSPSGGGHSVVYQLDGQFYACQNYEEGQIITPIVPEAEEGYTFSGWSGLPEVMPDHCVIATGKMNRIIIYSEGLLYEDIDENTCRVIGRGTCQDADIMIPPTYEGKTVTAIGVSERKDEKRPDPSAPYLFPFRNDMVIESLTVPSTVKVIGYHAFDGCRYLRNIIFLERENNEELRLCSNCFAYCGFRSIRIPSFVRPEYAIGDDWSITGSSIFYYNTELKEVVLEEGFTIADPEERIPNIPYASNFRSSGYSMFSYCTSLESISLPSTIRNIMGNFFENCTSLRNILINSRTLNRLGSYNFQNCQNDKKLKITFTGNAPIEYFSDTTLYNSAFDYIDGQYVGTEITIEYDGRNNGWSVFRNTNWDTAYATLVWHDISQD